MVTARYIYWQEGRHWLGYFEEFPDYMTQGESLEDLQEHLKDLRHDLGVPARADVTEMISGDSLNGTRKWDGRTQALRPLIFRLR